MTGFIRLDYPRLFCLFLCEADTGRCEEVRLGIGQLARDSVLLRLAQEFFAACKKGGDNEDRGPHAMPGHDERIGNFSVPFPRCL